MAAHFPEDNKKQSSGAKASRSYSGQATGSRFSRGTSEPGQIPYGQAYNTSQTFDSGQAFGSGEGHGYGYDYDYSQPKRKKKRGAGRVVGIIVAVVLVALLAVGGTCGYMLYDSAKQVKADAKQALAQVSAIKKAAESGDGAALSSAMDVIVAKTDSINAELEKPVWTIASYVPVYGEDVKTVKKLASSAETLVNDALTPISKSVSGLSLKNLITDGAVDVDLLSTLSSAVLDSLPTIQSFASEVSSLPEPHISQVKSIVDKIKEPISEAEELIDNAKPILENLPNMLGANGQTRQYLIIAQNNSELRATGGLPGSWGCISVTDGQISMGEFQSILHMDGLEVDMTEEERVAIATNMNTDPAQVNCTADFTRVGEMSQDYWEQVTGTTVDGVVAIDPIFLQRLLALTGGITAPDGTTVDGTNAAQVLLSDTYWKFGNDGTAQDEFFSTVAALCFDQVMSNLGDADLESLMNVFTESAKDGRILGWMANSSEEELMDLFGIAGELGSDATKPVLGVYFNDDTYSKMSWYFQANTTVDEGTKNADGTITYNCTTVVTNTVTKDIISKAYQYIYGGNTLKRSRDDIVYFMFLYGPAGGTISNVQVAGDGLVEDSEISTNTMSGLDVVRLHCNTQAQESMTVTYQVTCAAGSEALTVRTTPLAQESLM